MKTKTTTRLKTYPTIRRIVVLLPGLALSAAAFFLVFPTINSRLPLSLSIFLAYVLSAYVIVPVFYRIYIVFRPPTHNLPRYCITPDGLASDPVNIAIGGSRSSLMDSMQEAGWHKADSRNFKSLLHQFLSIVLRKPYLNAPFSTLYMFGRGQDIGFQKPLNSGKPSGSKRHHVRFWACVPGMLEGQASDEVNFWDKLYPSVDKGEVLWLGCASKDIGIVPIMRNLQLTHRVADDTDEERDLIVSDLKRTKLVENVTRVKAGEPLDLPNRAMWSSLSADGTLAVVDLKTRA
jgi:LssY C-terminus